MRLNIFQKAAPSLKEKKLNIDSDAFLSFMGQYQSGDWIYPDALHRELKISLKDIYSALEVFVDCGLTEQYLEIYCPNCQRFTGNIYKTALEIPEIVNCVHCECEILVPLQHAIIIYKVL